MKLNLNLKMAFHLIESFKFFANCYNSDYLDDPFILGICNEILSFEMRNNVSAECFYRLMDTILPKVSPIWDEETKQKLANVVRIYHENIVVSDDYSPRVKDLMTQLLISIKTRFNSNIQIMNLGSTTVSRLEDFRKLRSIYSGKQNFEEH